MTNTAKVGTIADCINTYLLVFSVPPQIAIHYNFIFTSLSSTSLLTMA